MFAFRPRRLNARCNRAWELVRVSLRLRCVLRQRCLGQGTKPSMKVEARPFYSSSLFALRPSGDVFFGWEALGPSPVCSITCVVAKSVLFFWSLQSLPPVPLDASSCRPRTQPSSLLPYADMALTTAQSQGVFYGPCAANCRQRPCFPTPSHAVSALPCTWPPPQQPLPSYTRVSLCGAPLQRGSGQE